MSKKKVIKLTAKPHYNKELDKTEVRFYNGKKRASEEEEKEYIKNNLKKIDREQLPKNLNAYYGRVLGGINASKKATRISGKFIPEKFIEQQGLEKVAEKRGYKDVNDLFKNEPLYYQKTKEIYSDAGTSDNFYSENVFRNIEEFNGRVFINGKEYTKIKAIHLIDRIDKKMKREFESVTNEFRVQFKKGNQLHFNIPDDEDIESEDGDVSSLMESQDGILPIVSPTTSKKERKKTIKDEEKPVRKRQYNLIVKNKDGKIVRNFNGTKKQINNISAKYESGKYKKETNLIRKKK